jgi:hypothetical protein
MSIRTKENLMNRSRFVPRTLAALSLLAVVAGPAPALAQQLFAIDSWDPRLWLLDPTDGSTIAARGLTSTSGNVSGGNGFAKDPISGTVYGIVEFSNDAQNRNLVTIDLETGVATVVGNLGAAFASIAFDASGTLYGVTGAAQYMTASSRNSLFVIDTTDATSTQVCRFATATQGHSLSFGGGLLYHATQAGTDFYGNAVLETVDPATFPVTNTDFCTTTNIPLDYDGGGVPVHVQSILVTSTGMGTAELLLSGWHNYNFCCDNELYSISVSAGAGTATFLGYTESGLKGMLFDATDPDVTDVGNISISKLSSKVREGNQRYVTFTVQVSNNGSTAVDGLTLTDNLDLSRLAYLSDDYGCDMLGGSVVTCDLGTLDAGETDTIQIFTTVICKGKNCSSVFNQATVTADLDRWVVDPSQAVHSANVTTPLKGKF